MPFTRLFVFFVLFVSSFKSLKVRTLTSRDYRTFIISDLTFALSATKSSKGAESEQPDAAETKKKLTLGGVFQLMAMGAGAPMLGEYKETDENGKMMFELEANNYNKELKSKNFNDGWVEDSADAINKPPGFFANLLSGGKLQEEWDAKNRKQ